MTAYVALLRGINVGGHHKIKMADLKQAFETMGFSSIQTYIQSGNVLFASNETEENLKNRIEQELARTFSFSIPTILRTSAEMMEIIENLPFSAQEIIDVEAASAVTTLYVCMFDKPPSVEAMEILHSAQGQEKMQLNGRDLYLLLPQGVRDSKLMNRLPKLNSAFTTRNWKTTSELANRARSIEE